VQIDARRARRTERTMATQGYPPTAITSTETTRTEFLVGTAVTPAAEIGSPPELGVCLGPIGDAQRGRSVKRVSCVVESPTGHAAPDPSRGPISSVRRGARRATPKQPPFRLTFRSCEWKRVSPPINTLRSPEHSELGCHSQVGESASGCFDSIRRLWDGFDRADRNKLFDRLDRVAVAQ
jgi:hypothetical protein